METRLTQSGFEFEDVELASAGAVASLDWMWKRYGARSCVLSSMQDTVVIDLAMRVSREMPVVFLDTGYHFGETLDVVRRVEDRYGIAVEVEGPITAPRDDIEPGECCDDKVRLLDRALAHRDAWASGIQRSQTDQRSLARIVGSDRRGLVKVSPLVQWSDADRDRYVASRDLIEHPLRAEGYTSIGCAPCTSPPNGDARSGRWAGTERTECGLHL